MLKFISKDLVTHYSFGLEIVEKGKKLNEINYLPTKTIRSGKYKNGKISQYFYNHCWERNNSQNIKTFPAFDAVIHNENSIVYVHDEQNRYYSIPKWYSAIQWAMAEKEYADYQLYNIKNGFKVSYVLDIPLAIFNGEKQEIEANKKKLESELTKKASSIRNNDGILVAYSMIDANGQEHRTTITPIQPSQLHEQFKVVNDTAFDKILAANAVTTPLILGSKTAGQLGSINELENAVNVLNNLVLLDYRKQIESVFNCIIGFYGIPGIVKLDVVNPFENKKFADIIAKYLTAINFVIAQEKVSIMDAIKFLKIDIQESAV